MTSPSPSLDASSPASAPPLPYESPPMLSPSSSSVSAILNAGIAAGVLGAAFLFVLLIIILLRRHRVHVPPSLMIHVHSPSPNPVNNASRARSVSIPQNPKPLFHVQPRAVPVGPFNYEDLVSVTNGFAESNFLGQGRFGLVYRGTLCGIEVAIRKLKFGSSQGDIEFREEVEIISRVQHRNLVTLVGYCKHEDQKYLVSEYVPNKTLDFHLHGRGRPTLDWLRRWKIALGSAKGLAYLHEDCDPKIIHGDITAANIQLDYNFEPKIADFRLAKFVPTYDISHAGIIILGIPGYVAPEYVTSGKWTDRSDVYSYGIMLLELITGRKPIIGSDRHSDQSLVNWAGPLLSKATTEEFYDELIDPWLETNYDQYEMTRLIQCAATAVRHSAKKRPRMGQIVRYLEEEISLEDLNAGMMLRISELKGGSTEQEVLRSMAFGGIISEDYVQPDRTSEYEVTSSSGANTEETEQRLNKKPRSSELL